MTPARLIAAGIGCRKGCAGEDIVRLVQLALEKSGFDVTDLTGLFAPAFKQAETGLAEAADVLNLPLVLVPDAALQAADGTSATRSERVVALTGLGSVAEAAALAGAGQGARLILPRIASKTATCAIAAS